MDTPKVGILTVATGKYIGFVDRLWTSIKEKFLPGDHVDKKFFLWTDNPLYEPVLSHIAQHDDPNGGAIIPKERLGFPGDTLFRYHFFAKAAQDGVFDNVDYLFYFDADMIVEDLVTEGGDLAPLFLGSVDLVAVTHPGYTWNGRMGTFEAHPASSAYVNDFMKRRTTYVAGGFLGGKTNAFLNMAQAIRGLVDKDQERGYTAVWHDESYLNAFVAYSQPKPLILHPGYCYPENCYGHSMHIPFHRYVVALEKDLKEYQGG